MIIRILAIIYGLLIFGLAGAWDAEDQANQTYQSISTQEYYSHE